MMRSGGSGGALALVVGLGLAGGFGGAGAQVGPLDLSNHLEPGLEFRYGMINTTRTTIPGMGEMAQSQRQVTLLEVVAPWHGGASALSVLTRTSTAKD